MICAIFRSATTPSSRMGFQRLAPGRTAHPGYVRSHIFPRGAFGGEAAKRVARKVGNFTNPGGGGLLACSSRSLPPANGCNRCAVSNVQSFCQCKSQTHLQSMSFLSIGEFKGAGSDTPIQESAFCLSHARSFKKYGSPTAVKVKLVKRIYIFSTVILSTSKVET